jgi:hypothetical protein
MAKAPVLTLDVGQSERHEVDVYYPSRRRGAEIYVDGARIASAPKRGTPKGTERYEMRVGWPEAHTVRIERLGGRRATFQASIDGWPAPDVRADRRAARLEGSAKKKRGKQRVRGPEKRAVRYFFAGLILVLLIWGIAIFVRNQVNDAGIASHGKAINTRIVGTAHETDDNGANDYLYVWIPACTCPVRVATDNPAAHPKGSTIGVLYDTADPTNARPLVDGNSAYGGWVIDIVFFGLAAFGVYCAYDFMSPEIARLRGRRTAKKSLPVTK